MTTFNESKVVLLRNLEEYSECLHHLRNHFGVKANSRAIILAFTSYMDQVRKIKEYKEHISELESKLHFYKYNSENVINSLKNLQEVNNERKG